MNFDKIYTLQTGVSLKISTDIIQELIANAMKGQNLPELEQIRCTTDLYDYLIVIVYKDAADLIKRRQNWITPKNKAALLAELPIAFRDFWNFFWRNLDEEDPDGDEWNRLIADESFNAQLSILLNRIRAVERRLQGKQESISEFDQENAYDMAYFQSTEFA